MRIDVLYDRLRTIEAVCIPIGESTSHPVIKVEWPKRLGDPVPVYLDIGEITDEPVVVFFMNTTCTSSAMTMFLTLFGSNDDEEEDEPDYESEAEPELSPYPWELGLLFLQGVILQHIAQSRPNHPMFSQMIDHLDECFRHYASRS